MTENHELRLRRLPTNRDFVRCVLANWPAKQAQPKGNFS